MGILATGPVEVALASGQFDKGIEDHLVFAVASILGGKHVAEHLSGVPKMSAFCLGT